MSAAWAESTVCGEAWPAPGGEAKAPAGLAWAESVPDAAGDPDLFFDDREAGTLRPRASVERFP